MDYFSESVDTDGDGNVSGASDGYDHGDDYDEMDDEDEESNSADLSRK